MKTKEAVKYVLELYGMSKYRLAMSLNLSPTSINQYLAGTRMSAITAETFNKVYGIEITDKYGEL